MKRLYTITAVSAVLTILAAFGLWKLQFHETEERQIKVGFIYIGDAATAYTYNFIKAMQDVEKAYPEQVKLVPKYNIQEGDEEPAFQELVDEGCSLIFSTSYGYGDTAKEFAKKYPQVEFCQATCENAEKEPVLANYHNFMGKIHEGRYICGIVAGMKLKELIDAGRITPEEAKAGYVGAFPYAEVISGYTAFFLGIRSVVPEATMEVIYTNTWSNFSLEKAAAEQLIADNCIVISQHSDTKGAAVACENTEKNVLVYHIGYNQGMADVAPTTNLTGCRIDWSPYMLAAVNAVLEGKKIESCVEGTVYGNDIGAGFDKGWVEMMQVNEVIAAPGTTGRVEELVEMFRRGTVQIFQGDYIGVNPFDETDTYDLRKAYIESKDQSAPSFHYVLQDVITVR